MHTHTQTDIVCIKDYPFFASCIVEHIVRVQIWPTVCKKGRGMGSYRTTCTRARLKSCFYSVHPSFAFPVCPLFAPSRDYCPPLAYFTTTPSIVALSTKHTRVHWTIKKLAPPSSQLDGCFDWTQLIWVMIWSGPSLRWQKSHLSANYFIKITKNESLLAILLVFVCSSSFFYINIR
jgi:hypothetical protein